MNEIDILLLTDNNLETVGGEQESTKIILEGICDVYRVGVVQPGCLSKKNPMIKYFELTSKTRIKHLVKNPFLLIKYIIELTKIIKKYNPKIIHTQAQVSFFTAALLKNLRLIDKNIVLIHTERGLYAKYSPFFLRVFFFSFKALNILVTTTHFNMSSWKQAVENKNIILQYKIIENTAGKLFELYDDNEDKYKNKNFTIGFSGRYTEWKNWPLAISIIKNLEMKTNCAINVKMAVGCLDEKSLKETTKMFELLSAKLGNRFEGRININMDQMEKFYYDLDLFILTSKKNTESFGRTLVEAMSRKTAVLTSDAGGSVEVVGKKENICYSLDQFIDRSMFLFNDSDELDREKNDNLTRVRTEYSYQSNIDKHKRLYKAIL